MNTGIWIFTKSGQWYKPNVQDELREVVRIVTHADNGFIPCKDEIGRETFVNTSEVESVRNRDLDDSWSIL
ncbi:hypothetical protein CD110_03900 [Staphylococcus casei]|uniref:hypothetical protein n=1 Tax=Staphylococcus casei TaxID=201828 RepID=UPI000CD172AA|nr:hypothetical protein [Staphylococcus casei]PNZ60922.1 hypothetical protein CD110_03900 [Staphylococcus casei]WJE87411.1 hypothetical protein QMO72_05580 [Staphylococcus casei]